jgi:hypothetical protein
MSWCLVGSEMCIRDRFLTVSVGVYVSATGHQNTMDAGQSLTEVCAGHRQKANRLAARSPHRLRQAKCRYSCLVPGHRGVFGKATQNGNAGSAHGSKPFEIVINKVTFLKQLCSNLNH